MIRTIKEERVDLSDYLDYAQVRRHIAHFLEWVYMHKYIHSALGYLTPVEFETQWFNSYVNELSYINFVSYLKGAVRRNH